MTPHALLLSLRDPAGVPFYPQVFQFLSVLTFTLHILFVNTTVGGALLAVWGRWQGTDFGTRLARGSAKLATVSTSLAILMGVAPLLFVQVIYDPAWYTSNMLSASWVIGFLFIMMIAYSAMYLFTFAGEEGSSNLRKGLGWATLSLVLYLVAGAVMHALQFQSLFPEKWIGWATSGNALSTAGTSLHAFDIGRFLHFIIPAPAVTGIVLMLYAWYARNGQAEEDPFARQCGEMGAKIAFLFTVMQMAVGFWWLLMLPSEFAFLTNPLVILGIILALPLLHFMYKGMKDPAGQAIPTAVLTFLTVFVMSTNREQLRMKYFGLHGFNAADYPINIDWASTALFVGTFLLGLVVIGYIVTTVFLAGRANGTYEASPSMQRWGNISIGLLLTWLVVVVALGIVISIRNMGG